MANVSFCYTPLTFVETRWLRKIAAAVAAGEDVRPPPAKVRDDSLFDDMTQNPCNRKDARLEAVGGKIGGPSAKIGGRAVVPARPFISSDFFLENRGNNGLSKAGLAALAKLEKVIEAVPSAAALENERANVKEGKIHHISLGYTGDGQWGKTTAAKLRAQLVEDTSIKGVWQRQLFDAVVVLANAEKITDWTAAGVGVTGTVAPTVLLNARTGVHVDGKNWGWSTQVVGGTYARVAAEGENVGNGVPEARGGRLFVHDPAGKDYQEYERKDADLQLPSLQVGMWDKVAQRTGKTDAALPGQFFVCPIFDVGSGGVDSVTAGELVWGRYIDCWRKKIRFNGAFPHATERLTHEQMVGGYRVVITFYKKKPNEDARAIWALLGGLGVQGLPEAKGGGDVEGAGGSGVAGKVGGATSSKKAGGGGTASGKGKAVKKSGDKKGKK